MGQLSTYTEINITKENLPNLKKLLETIDNNSCPYIINFSQLENVDPLFLGKIKNYLGLKINHFRWPYPIYFLGARPLLKSDPLYFYKRRDIPRFYALSNKKVARSHISLLKFTKSAEKTFEYYNFTQTEKQITEYAQINKKIHLLAQEVEFYRKILQEAQW